MVDQGVNINAFFEPAPYFPETILTNTALGGDLPIIQALLDAGSDPRIRTIKSEKDGSPHQWLNAADWARLNDDPSVQVVLRAEILRLDSASQGVRE